MKAADDGRITLISANHMGEPDGIPGSLLQSGQIQLLQVLGKPGDRRYLPLLLPALLCASLSFPLCHSAFQINTFLKLKEKDFETNIFLFYIASIFLKITCNLSIDKSYLNVSVIEPKIPNQLLSPQQPYSSQTLLCEEKIVAGSGLVH